ncbi:endonuclease-reverse transcriptase [Plakobranchus ocellatus]|uniref:Endonuclease-reverse transcriptase n=1 Tax=Plakobranchus ocellatus TaxID=259542 RepID=A0AAV4E171_9GAST|nr:endonuclease-reverse transcriptase [Plakobranchus ocellatus]
MQLKIKLQKCLVWTVKTYGADGWTLHKADVKKIEFAEIWCYRRLTIINWNDKRILHQLNKVQKRNVSFFGHGCKSKYSQARDYIQGKLKGKRGNGKLKLNKFDNSKGWTKKNRT